MDTTSAQKPEDDSGTEPRPVGDDTPATSPAPVGATAPDHERAADAAPSAGGTDLPPVSRGVRVGTVVWGLVVAAVGVGLLAWARGLMFDVELSLIVLVAAAGVALLVGSLMNAARRKGS